MKNFEAHYSVVGTAALKVDASEQQIQAPVIEFPLLHARSNGQHATQDRRMKMVDLALMRELRTGSVQGKGFGRIAPWQSVSAGIILAASTFATIFIGL